jgi:NADH:ubiquinone oxidoreductase subunit D
MPVRPEDPRQLGIPLDLRRDRPYSIYDRLEFDVCVGTGERGSSAIAGTAIGQDAGDEAVRAHPAPVHRADARRRLPRQAPARMKVPAGEVYAEYENPRGHLGFYIESQGGPIPYRVHIRGPSFINLAVTGELCRNVLLADVPAIVGSIDIVMGEVDR